MIRLVKAYSKFTCNELKRMMAYKVNVYIYIICSMFTSFINYYFWKAVYSNSDKTILGGLQYKQMVVYVFASFVATRLVMVDVSNNIYDDIVKGNIANNLIKPINYKMTLISRAIGKMIYGLLFPALPIIVSLEIYRHNIEQNYVVNIARIIAFVVSMFFSMMIYVLLDYLIGLIGFFTTYVYGLNLAKKAIISFFSGSLIPLTFFPSLMERILTLLPFSSMIYSPVIIFVKEFNNYKIKEILYRQLIWIIILFLLGEIVWKKVIKKLVVLGG